MTEQLYTLVQARKIGLREVSPVGLRSSAHRSRCGRARYRLLHASGATSRSPVLPALGECPFAAALGRSAVL
jgi:hypothetical protein